jgi:Spy/CpxP family protein refolding chaperone
VQNRLGLTDQQLADIRSLLQTQRTAARADVQSLVAARRLLRTLLEQPTPDPSAIQAAATQVKGLQAKLFDNRLQAQLDLRSKLTPEQWRGGHGASVDAARGRLQVRSVGGSAPCVVAWGWGPFRPAS